MALWHRSTSFKPTAYYNKLNRGAAQLKLAPAMPALSPSIALPVHRPGRLAIFFLRSSRHDESTRDSGSELSRRGEKSSPSLPANRRTANRNGESSIRARNQDDRVARRGPRH